MVFFICHECKKANVELLQDAVIAKDITGEWCYNFAEFVKEANVKLLQDAVIERMRLGNGVTILLNM